MSGQLVSPFAECVDGWVLGSPSFVQVCRGEDDSLAVRSRTLEDLTATVAEEFQTTVDSLLALRRHRNRAREAAILLAREFRSDPLAALAEVFGGSRSAIVEAANRARNRERTEVLFRETVQRIRARLSE